MGKALVKFLVFVLGVALVGCASGHCRGSDSVAEASKLKWNDEAAMKKKRAERVFVFRPDGSLQCGMGQALKPDVMATQLKDIQIFSMDNRNDGLMRMQVCGSPTGRINVYEISALDLEKATKADFKELKDQ